MISPEDYALLRSNMEEAGEHAAKTGAQFNKTQEEVNDSVVQGSQQLSYLAAGTISLSITFFGYLLGLEEPARDVLQTPMFHTPFPLLWILFGSWIVLSITVIIGLLYRFVNAWYLHAAVGSQWANANAEAKKKILESLEAGFPIVFRETKDQPEGVANVRESHSTYERLSTKFKRKSTFYLVMVSWLRRITVVSFIVGVVLLLLFVITFSYSIV